MRRPGWGTQRPPVPAREAQGRPASRGNDPDSLFPIISLNDFPPGFKGIVIFVNESEENDEAEGSGGGARTGLPHSLKKRPAAEAAGRGSILLIRR